MKSFPFCASDNRIYVAPGLALLEAVRTGCMREERCLKKPYTVGQPPSKFYEYFFLEKFPQLFCLQSRHVGHTNFGTWRLANSFGTFFEASAYTSHSVSR